MSAPSAGLAFLALLIAALMVAHVPLGDYMYRAYSSERDRRIERVIYCVIGADPLPALARGPLAEGVH